MRIGAMGNARYKELHFRRATAQDAAAVAACVQAAYQHYVERIGKPPSPMLDDYRRVIAQRDVRVAQSKTQIVGVLVLAGTDDGFLLENVAVDPRVQGKGIGQALLEIAEGEARRQGYESIYLYTHEKMTENLALYKRRGYVEYERRHENGYDRIYMRKVFL